MIISIFNGRKYLPKPGRFQFVKLTGWHNFWLRSLSLVALSDGALIVASFNLTFEEIGLLGATIRAAMLIGFILTSVNLITAPKFSEIYSTGDIHKLRIYAQKSTLLMIGASAFILTFIFIFSDFIMSIFGNEFTKGTDILLIICLSQFFRVAFGSVSSLLNMTGNARDCKNVSLLLVFPFIVLVYYFADIYGVYGVAYSFLIIQLIQSLILYGFILKRLGFSTINLNIKKLLKSR